MSEAAMFRLSEALQGSVLKTNDAEPRVLLKFVKRGAGRKVMTLTVELLARLLETKADQRSVIRIPGELCITPVPPKGKKNFDSIRWTRIDVVGECTAHDAFPLTRMEFLQLQHHHDAMRDTVAQYAAGLRRSREAPATEAPAAGMPAAGMPAAEMPAVLRQADTETARLRRRNNKRKNVAYDETGPPCGLLILEPMPTPPSHDITAHNTPTSATLPEPESESKAESESLMSQETVPQMQDIPQTQEIPQTLELLD